MSKNYYIIPVFISHQGCPHQCVFCNQDRIARVVEDEVTESDVRKTIDDYLETIDAKGATLEVSFFGGTFTAIPVQKQNELLSVALEYKNRGLIHNIRLSTRPDAINRYILDYLKEYKVDIIELGVQSLDDEVLIKAGRGHTAEQVKEASILIKDYNFTLGHQIMPGLPGDTFEKDIYTTKASISMKPDICRIYPALIIKDTPMEKMYERGEYIPYSLKEAVDISTEMLKLYKEAKIKVIRIGLQPTESITWGQDIIDGPFHPAFRELVEGNLICSSLKEKAPCDKDIIIEINPKDVSKLYTNKKEYFKEFTNNRSGKVFVKVENKVKRNRIRLTVIEKKEEFKI